jgi:hypothetical protein
MKKQLIFLMPFILLPTKTEMQKAVPSGNSAHLAFIPIQGAAVPATSTPSSPL